MLRASSTVGPRLTQPGLDYLYATGFAEVVDYTDWLSIEKEFNALFARILYLAARARHVFFVSAVHTENLIGLLANSCTNAVHGRITATQNDHRLAFEIDKLFRRLSITHLFIDVSDQVIERLMDTGKVFARKPALHRFVGPHPEENCIEPF